MAKPLESSQMKLADYLATRVPADLGVSDQIRLLVSTFLATGVSVVVVHEFLPGGERLGDVLVHALVLSSTYTVCVLVVGGLLFFVVQRAKLEVEAWHLWVVSFLAYNLGHFLYVPLGENSRFALHPDASSESPWLHYARLVPIWMVITYLFIQTHTRRALEKELSELQRLNAELTDGKRVPSEQRITLTSGRTTVSLESDRVSHISVDDHYCYFHYRDDDGWRKTDVALPLKQVLQQIPSPFLLIHRSHVVNPVHLKRIERDNRAYRLVLANDVVLPISRQRLNDVLPKVRAYLESG